MTVPKLITIMLVGQYFVISFQFLYHCGEFEQVNSGWVILYAFSYNGESVWMKDTCLHFVINASRQGNNVKIEYDLKINLQRLESCLVFWRHIHNPVKQIIWSVLQKPSSWMFHLVLNTSPIILSGNVSVFSVISSTLNE